MGTDIAAGNVMDAADTAMNVVADAVTAGATDMKQAMRQRHTVRKFTSEPLSPELISQLNDRVRANNERFGLAISLKVGDESALPGALKLFLLKACATISCWPAATGRGWTRTLATQAPT